MLDMTGVYVGHVLWYDCRMSAHMFRTFLHMFATCLEHFWRHFPGHVFWTFLVVSLTCLGHVVDMFREMFEGCACHV